MGNKIKAVFFDLDGTLVNTLESLKKTMNDTMEHYSLEGVSLEETKKFVGTGSKKFVERTLEKNAQVWYDKAEKWEEKDEEKAMDLDLKGDEVMEQLEEAYDYYRSIFPKNCTYKVEAYPGIISCLDNLKEKGIFRVCITNKPKEEAVIILQKLFAPDSFNMVLGDNAKVPLKPNPDMLLYACKELGISSEEAIMVGDTKTDLDAAKNAGMISIGCLYGFRDKKELEEHGAKHLVKDGDELWQILKEYYL